MNYFQDATDTFTGLVLYIPRENCYELISDIASLAAYTVQQTTLRYVHTVQIQGRDREELVRKIEEKIKNTGAIILSRIEYGGYVVTRSYEDTEYRSEIVRSE